MSEEHLTTEQPRHQDPGMDALIKHLDQPQAAEDQPRDDLGQFAGEATEEDAEPEPLSGLDSEPESQESDEDPYVPVTVGGVEQEVPLSELIRGYSREADYTRKTQSLSEERKAVEQERAQLMLAGQQAVQRSAQLAAQLQQELQNNQPDPNAMARLRVEDPGEYAAQIADQQRKGMLLQQAQQQAHNIQQHQNQERVLSERSALGEKEPAFASDFDSTYAGLGKWVTDPNGGGVSVDDWNNEYDHNRILIAYRAWKADEQASVATDRNSAVRARVANLPRVRSGAPTEPGHSEREAYAAAVTKHQASGTVRDIAKALMARDAVRKTRR